MKKWQKNTLTVVGVIIIMYLMIYIRVRSEASREFKEAEKYYNYAKQPDTKRSDMLALIAQKDKKKFTKETFAREMKEYYFSHKESAKPDLDELLNKGAISKEEHEWLIKELTDIKEIFESDIKTAYYGYRTVLDIWLDPPGWPRSILRNIELANKTRERLKEVEPKFNEWVNEAAPPVSEAKKNPVKPR